MTVYSFPAISVTQPIGEFYLCAISAKHLIQISSADVRRLLDKEFDEYIGIQRRLSPERMKEINEYVNSFDATFPTSVILAVDEDAASFDPAARELTLTSKRPDGADLAVIIDGQHRIEGLKAFMGETFEVPVCIFVGADMQTKSTIFATVNLAQTKVNRSLAYDLLAYEKKTTPQKVCHRIAVSLDSMQVSPFFRRIKRLGVATEGRTFETLTQATVVESLISLISDNANRDRNEIWMFGRAVTAERIDAEKYPFAALFLSGKESDILANVVNYFIAVRRQFPRSWEGVNERGNILPRTNGFRVSVLIKPLFGPTSGLL
jgi:DGQHR domain-containing protein